MKDAGASCTPLKHNQITMDDFLAYATVRAEFQICLARLINRLTGQMVSQILNDKVDPFVQTITAEYRQMDMEKPCNIILKWDKEDWAIEFQSNRDAQNAT